MSKSVVSIKVRKPCVFCGHKHKQIDKYCQHPSLKHLECMEKCMSFEECPQFDTYPINELRFIAYHYAKYKKAIPENPYRTYGTKYNHAFGYDPIPLTLSKNRMVKALVDRWNVYETFRKTKASTCEETMDDCPICMEPFMLHKWCDHFARIAVHTQNNGCIITACKHRFCGKCWGHLLLNNVKEIGYENHVWNHTRCLNCPMCRQQVQFSPSIENQLTEIGQQLIDGTYRSRSGLADIAGRIRN